MGPADLGQVLSRLNLKPDVNLLVGADTADDAAVYKLNAEQAVVNTLDFFTPMVDDPYAFGQVAAANALSDVYAMGGVPLVALNIVVFPKCLPLKVLEQILAGGADKVAEAGARLAGGHSIAEESPIYGLAVTGVVHPERIWTNVGAQPEDVLVLTKPLGSGIVCTAVKGGLASADDTQAVVNSMATLNKEAADAAQELSVHACTDVTGFGLLGHLLELAQGSGVAIELDHRNIPVLPGAREYASMGLIPGGCYRNQKHGEGMVIFSQDVSKIDRDIYFDPQTSGGLILSLPAEQASKLVDRGLGWAIGRVEKLKHDTKLLHIY